MLNECLLLVKRFETRFTLVRPFSRVNSDVPVHVDFKREVHGTVFAFERLFAGVRDAVQLERASLRERFAALFAGVRFFAGVHAPVVDNKMARLELLGAG